MTEPSVFEIAMAYQKTAALTAAVKLDLFTLIGKGSTTVDAIEPPDAGVYPKDRRQSGFLPACAVV